MSTALRLRVVNYDIALHHRQQRQGQGWKNPDLGNNFGLQFLLDFLLFKVLVHKESQTQNEDPERTPVGLHTIRYDTMICTGKLTGKLPV